MRRDRERCRIEAITEHSTGSGRPDSTVGSGLQTVSAAELTVQPLALRFSPPGHMAYPEPELLSWPAGFHPAG